MSKRPEKTINKNTAKTAKRLLKYVTDTYPRLFTAIPCEVAEIHVITVF